MSRTAVGLPKRTCRPRAVVVSFCFSYSSDRVVVAVTSDSASEPVSSGSGPGVCVCAS